METGFRLEASQRRELVALHRKEHSARYADRLKTILWRDEGITPREIAHLLFGNENERRPRAVV